MQTDYLLTTSASEISSPSVSSPRSRKPSFSLSYFWAILVQHKVQKSQPASADAFSAAMLCCSRWEPATKSSSLRISAHFAHLILVFACAGVEVFDIEASKPVPCVVMTGREGG